MDTPYDRKINARFKKYWEKRKDHKQRIYLQFFLIWGIVGSGLTYLLSIKFNFSQFDLLDYSLRVIFWSLGSLLYSWWHIKSQEKHYRKIQEFEAREAGEES